MSDNYYHDLREFIEVLDHQGLLTDGSVWSIRTAS